VYELNRLPVSAIVVSLVVMWVVTLVIQLLLRGFCQFLNLRPEMLKVDSYVSKWPSGLKGCRSIGGLGIIIPLHKKGDRRFQMLLMPFPSRLPGKAYVKCLKCETTEPS